MFPGSDKLNSIDNAYIELMAKLRTGFLTTSRHLAEWQSRFMLTVVFFVVVVPMGLVMRLSSLIQSRKRPESYFREVHSSTPLKESMERPF